MIDVVPVSTTLASAKIGTLSKKLGIVPEFLETAFPRYAQSKQNALFQF